MSIEKLLGDLIDALKENTAAIMAGVNAKTEIVTAAAKLVDKAKTTKAPAKEEDDEKPARTSRARSAKEEDDEKPARRSAAKEEDDEKPSRRSAAKDEPESKYTLADIKKGYGEYLDHDDDDIAAKRTAAVKKIAAHLGLNKISEAKPKHFDKLMEWLDDLRDGYKPDLSGDDDSGNGD